jgi:hypothetical protein
MILKVGVWYRMWYMYNVYFYGMENNMAVAVYLYLSDVSGSHGDECVGVAQTARRNIPEDSHLESIFILSCDGDS